MNERRRFNAAERAAMYAAADGRCANCGAELEPGWHADHVIAYSRGGKTHVTNGQSLCPDCNWKKGNRIVRKLLPWQEETLDQYRRAVNPARFLVAAFPGMGKTELASAILSHTGRFGIILVPQADSLSSWRATLHGRGICPAARIEGRTGAFSLTCASCGKRTRAVVMTYDLAASHPNIIARIWRKHGPCLLICDEVHHLLDQRAWAEPIVAARPYIDAVLALSATPFRTDEKPVPFVHTEGPWTRNLSPLPEHCVAEYTYGKALTTMKPPPVTRAVFERYDADVTWLESDIDGNGRIERTVTLSEKSSKKVARRARRHALDARGNWLQSVLRRADDQLTAIRETDRRGGGIIVCKDTDHAVSTADRLVSDTAGDVVVYTEQYATMRHRIGNGRLDEDGRRIGHESGDILEQYKSGDGKWIVTVRKISEGVDVPRLRVLVYATVTRTKLFFIQVLGRVIRVVRELPEDVDQTAWVFIPDDEEMRSYAAEVENGIADAEIAADDEEEDETITCFGPSSGDRDVYDRFVSAEPEYSGAIADGQAHDPELAELARQLGGQPNNTLATLRELRNRGLLNLAANQEQPAASHEPATVDPTAHLRAAVKKKDDAVRSWAGLRVRAGHFPAYKESVMACHRELGDEFGVWSHNKNVTVEQVGKATHYARERIRGLRHGL